MLTCFLTDVDSPDMIPHYDRGMLTEFRVAVGTHAQGTVRDRSVRCR